MNWIEPDTNYPTAAQEKLDHIRDHLDAVLTALYETGDVEALEGHIGELCWAVELTQPSHGPALEKKNKNRSLHWHLGYQRAMMDLNKIKEKTND